MLIAIEGIAGAGKSTVRDRLLHAAQRAGIPLHHVGQFSWLSLPATRAIIDLRAGRSVSEPEARAAVITDLRLHAEYNINLARTAGHVVADRLLLSTASLLALVYRTDPARYLAEFVHTAPGLPDVTLFLATPVHVCQERLRKRRTAKRFTDDPRTAVRLAALYQQSADAWSRLTGSPTIVGPSTTSEQAEQLVTTVMAHLAATSACRASSGA